MSALSEPTYPAGPFSPCEMCGGTSHNAPEECPENDTYPTTLDTEKVFEGQRDEDR